MRSPFVAAAAALLAAMLACADTPQAEAEGTDATTQDLLSAASADAAAGSLPPGAPRAVGAQTRPQTVDIAVMGVDRGSPDALLRIVEFSDYGCGYCRKFHQETWPALVKDFVGPGKVEWKFLPYVSGMFENSPTATVAAECVLEQGDEVFEGMNRRLWDEQRAWKGATDPQPVVREMARASGADMAEYDACMSEGRRAWRVDAATELARQVGVRATPTFFIVGFQPIQGALPTDVFLQVVGAAYEEAVKAGGDR